MRFATFFIACGALAAGVATASAKPNTGGGGESSCQQCVSHISLGLTPVFTCEVARFAGRKECQTSLLGRNCTESGDYCGFFFPSPNPVIA